MVSKAKICLAVNQLLADKIAVTEQAMMDAQLAANNETKSSAGDKYETGRAMSQNEKDINARHLADLLKMKKSMGAIDPKKTMDQVEFGAVVETNQLCYFISIGLGIVKTGRSEIMTISALSPIGQSLLGRKSGESIEWRGQTLSIISVT